ncbi:hypothetical protein GcM3_076024, partial [Golovinomyces cichoracearum]
MACITEQLSSGNDDNTFFTTLLKYNPIRNYPLTNIVLLTGQVVYETSAIFLITIWRTNGMHELVVDGRKNSKDADTEEVRAYTVLYNVAIGIFLQAISSDILKLVLEQSDPHLMWIYLVTKYKKDTTYAHVYQVGTFCQLITAYGSLNTLADYIQLFKTEWNKLCRLARDSNEEYRQDFAKFLQKDLAKRDFLLGFLSRYKKDVVDNLTTKLDLTFAAVKQHLLDIDYEEVTDTALITSSSTIKKSVLSRPSSIFKKTKDNTCSYFKKHYPKSNLNHRLFKFERLKEDKKKTKKDINDRQDKNIKEALMTTTSEEVRQPKFFLDACASTHMCPHIERFENLLACFGVVNSSSGESIEDLGKGTVILHYAIKSGKINEFVLHNVLYVSKLQHS